MDEPFIAPSFGGPGANAPLWGGSHRCEVIEVEPYTASVPLPARLGTYPPE